MDVSCVGNGGQVMITKTNNPEHLRQLKDPPPPPTHKLKLLKKDKTASGLWVVWLETL